MDNRDYFALGFEMGRNLGMSEGNREPTASDLEDLKYSILREPGEEVAFHYLPGKHSNMEWFEIIKMPEGEGNFRVGKINSDGAGFRGIH